MRRIPRLRRPSGLASTTHISRSAGLSKITRCGQPSSAPFSSSSAQSKYTLSRRPTARSPYPHNLNQLYSSEKQTTPVQAKEEEQELEQRQQEEDLATEEYAALEDEVDVVSTGPYKAPPPRINAARIEEVADPTYAPATSADGLKTVGGVSNWWNKSEHWDPSGDFIGFKPKEKVTDPALIDVAVRRAVIEAFALREAGREDDLVGVWPTTLSKADTQALLAREVKTSENGAVTLGAAESAAVAEQLRWKDDVETTETTAEESSASPETLSAEEAAALALTWDRSWGSTSIADPRIRFAITKRIFQLTGHLIPDHQLSSITTVSTLLHTLKKPPKPATLTQEIQERRKDLLELPNVTVAPKRVTRGDKEIALGRFKIMQQELEKRGLPVHGHGNAPKGKEIERLQGGV